MAWLQTNESNLPDVDRNSALAQDIIALLQSENESLRTLVAELLFKNQALRFKAAANLFDYLSG